MIDSIKKCLLHDLVDNFVKIISSDWEDYRCIQTETKFHLSYLTLWNVQFRNYSDDLLIFFDVSQHDQANFVIESDKYNTSIKIDDKDNVY